MSLSHSALILPAALAATCAVLIGCGSIERVGVAFLYRKAELPERQIVRNVPYLQGAAAEPKHRLDLFMPSGTNWPILVFVHGGGWTSGDKGLRVGGADVYANIGRFYANHGIGVAVINYRLLPTVTWREQLQDVAQAVGWVQTHISEYGGDPHKLFLSGHSSGAQIVARLGLDSKLAEPFLRSPTNIAGVITVSGAGLDLADQRTYELGESENYYAARFSNEPDWQRLASPITFVQSGAPPFLILYAGGEKPSLQRQAQLLQRKLAENHVPNRLVVVPGQSHSRIVLTLSRDDKSAGPAILNFIKTAPGYLPAKPW